MAQPSTSQGAQEKAKKPLSSKLFHDVIYGHMEFDEILVQIIDTPQFQRLRDIKQMGGAYFVYPGASHTRFEHSLGVAHLAGELVRSLQRNQPELNISENISERDVRCVEIAALCHDLGHGPFSHMFDLQFIPEARKEKKKENQEQTGSQPNEAGGSQVEAAKKQNGCQDDKKWKHEEASVRIFDSIVRTLKNGGFDLEKELKKLKGDDDGSDLDFIKEMIIGPKDKIFYKGRPRVKAFLYEIVANKRNNIDVDKLDYFARDFYHLGIKNEFDYRRFIKFARVCEVDGDWQICVRDKELENMYELFHTRTCIHRKVCQHKTIKIIEHMITEALLKADSKLKIFEKVKAFYEIPQEDFSKLTKKQEKHLNDFCGLTDSIFEEILYSTAPHLKDAREILQKIMTRELYPFLGKIRMTDAMAKSSENKEELIEKWKKELTQMSVMTAYYKGEGKLEPRDLEIKIVELDFGMKDKNPVERLRFYSKFNETTGFKIPNKQVSQLLLPSVFLEKWIYVYCRDRNKLEVAKRHFDKWCDEKDFDIPQKPSPMLSTAPLSKVFNDPIHGSMEFHPVLVRIIDTPQFQRLRFRKRLGAAFYVYPGASHNCFEHSLGVAHLAGQFVRRLQETQPELGIDNKDVLKVEIAGLCRGLADWPLIQESKDINDQTFTEDLHKIYPVVKDTSADIFEDIVNHIKEKDPGFLSEDDIQDICKIMNGEKDTVSKPFLSDIVNNETGLDVSVFDSVARDCYQLGLKTDFYHQRLFKYAKVDGNDICFSAKVMYSMLDLVHTQAALYRKAYTHRFTLATQLMMVDIVKENLGLGEEDQAEPNQAGTGMRYSEPTDALLMGRTSAQVGKNQVAERLHTGRLYQRVSPDLCSKKIPIRKLKDELKKEGVKEEDFGDYLSTFDKVQVEKVKFYDNDGEPIEDVKEKLEKLEKIDNTSVHLYTKMPLDPAEVKKVIERLDQQAQQS